MPRPVGLLELIRGALAVERESIHTAVSGIVQSYNAETQEADVLPAVRDWYTDPDTGERSYEDMPVIPQVPVAWPRFGGYVIAGPLAKGDHVLLIFEERETTQYRLAGEVAGPLDTRRHDMSHAVAYPCEIADARKLGDHAAAGAQLVIGRDGGLQVRVGNDAIDLGGGSSDYVALAAKVATELQKIVDGFNAHVHGLTSLTNPTSAPTVPMGAPSDVSATAVKAK